VTCALLETLEGPIMSTTLKLPGVEYSLSEPQAIADLLGHQVDLIIDVGHCDVEPTSVIDLTQDFPKIIREGKGDCKPFRSL
jgi:tRNA A37 threonylcarbamoyladenosine synthetase subunit TsaC/SUA5/YrdC